MVTLRLIATLKDSAGNPLGGKTIEFYHSLDGVNYTLIGTATTDTSGQASITYEATQAGTHYFKARFPGDEYYEASEATATYTVAAAKPIWQQPWFWLLIFILLILFFAGGGGGGGGGVGTRTYRGT